MCAATATSSLTGASKPSVYRPQFQHVGVFTTRPDDMLDWYRTVLGMEITLVPRHAKGAFVSNDDCHHRMGFLATPGLQEDTHKRDHARIGHLAFEYPDLETLLNSWELIAQAGIEPVLCCDHGTTISLYYKDPDHNTIELVTDVLTREECMKHMESEQMKENPMGRNIDPAKVLAALRGGLTLKDIHTKAMAGDYQPDTPPDPLAAV